MAHLIGWNRNIRTGCEQILAGVVPFYHVDALNDYRTLNAEFMARYSSTDPETLLAELADGKDALRAFFQGASEQDWDRDFGPQHYRGRPATIGRCAKSITGDYVDHAKEIGAGRKSESR